MRIEAEVGPQVLADGSFSAPRMGRGGEQIFSELHGRYFEQNYRQAVFSGGMTVTAFNNATFTSATLGATCTPIIGLWNPPTSGKHAVLIQAALQVIITALQNTGGGPFVWASSVGNAAISTGNQPYNRVTGLAAGSVMKDLSGLALTGLTNNLVVRCAAAIAGGSVFGGLATLDTAAGFGTLLAPSVENFDGLWIVPPGGVIALLATATPVAQSAAAALVWEEVSV